MADVYYRVAGRPAATFTSCGPGSANIPVCLANAYFDSVPYLAITGNVPTNQFNRGAFQETYRHYQADFPSVVRPFCKRVFQPTRAEQFPLFMRQAWKTMVTGRPGPVVLDVPFDIFKEEADVEMPQAKDWNANISCRCGADPEGVRKAVDMLLDAKRPVIMVGQGVKYAAATAELVRLAERLQIPVVLFIERHGRYRRKSFARARPHRSQWNLSGEPCRTASRCPARSRSKIRRPHLEQLASGLFVQYPAD